MLSGMAEPETDQSHCPLKVYKVAIENRCEKGGMCNGPSPRSGHRCATDDINLYSFGGYNPNANTHHDSGPLFRELWKFNLATKVWTKIETTGPSPHALASHAAIIVANHLLVYGGTGIPFGNASSNSLHACNLSTFEWKEIKTTGEKPQKLYGQSICLADGCLLAFGGTTGFEYNNDLHSLDLKTCVWSELKPKGPKPAERYRHEVAYNNGLLYIFGGGMANENFGFDVVPTFDIQACEWCFISSNSDQAFEEVAEQNVPSSGIPSARKYHGLVQKKQDVYICGGFNDVTVFDDIWKIHLPTMQWTRLSSKLPLPVFFHASTMTSNGCLYLFGGVTHADQSSRTNDVYRMWVSVPSLLDICWHVILKSVPDASSVLWGTWLQLGVPLSLVHSIDQRAHFA